MAENGRPYMSQVSRWLKLNRGAVVSELFVRCCPTYMYMPLPVYGMLVGVCVVYVWYMC